MFRTITAFFTSRTAIAHWITTASTVVIGFYYSDSAFHTLVHEGINSLPTWARGVVVAVGLAALNYYNSKKSTTSAQTTFKYPPVALILVCVGLLAFPSTVKAQLPTNLYAVGGSYNSGASTPIAGSALYARLTTDSTYAFTALDILPISVSPFTVSTNVSAGVAQKILTWENINFFTPTSAGISITGNNTGWTWTSGVLADYNIKKSGKATQYHVMPNVRWLKSSVSNGSGYQLIGGVMVGWGTN